MTTKEGLERLRTKYNINNGWKYGGGCRKKEYIHGLDEYNIVETSHSKYYENHLRPEWAKKGYCSLDYFPKHKDKCLCDHFIDENCFIYKERGNTISIRIIGNCCIKKFGLQGRRCQICDSLHKNTRDNYCNVCRDKIKKEEKEKKRREMYCDCGRKKKKKSHGLCRSCYFNHPMWD
jgi:hypothetical protein